ncbi:6-O-methylguanine DNA methyltransferase, DNA binding domain [compost metagenome]
MVRILHSMSSSHVLPWHRVLNSHGRISLPEGDGGEFQRLLLEGEGVEFGLGGSVNLSRFGYFPEEDELAGMTEDI